MNLQAILDATTYQQINKDKQIVFHSVGDTGGVTTPTYIDGVSHFMQCDMNYINPPDRLARAVAVFTMASVVAPAVGPVVGGYLTEDYSWR